MTEKTLRSFAVHDKNARWTEFDTHDESYEEASWTWG